MGFFDKVKEVSKKTAIGISKTIKTIQIENAKNNEAYQVKRGILLKLSLDELKNLAYLIGLKNLEIQKYLDKDLKMQERKIKLNKFDYVDKIAKTSYTELVLKLKHLHKSSLADEMQREISFIEKRYGEEAKAVKENISKEDLENNRDILLLTFMNTIVEEIIGISPEHYKKEREYQVGLKEALKVVVKKDFPKSKVSVTMEYPTKTGKKIDIMIQIDNYRIGLELKYNLSSSGNFQRVVGQSLEYQNFTDALIIVQYETLDNEIGINNLKELKSVMKIPLKVIAHGVVKI